MFSFRLNRLFNQNLCPKSSFIGFVRGFSNVAPNRRKTESPQSTGKTTTGGSEDKDVPADVLQQSHIAQSKRKARAQAKRAQNVKKANNSPSVAAKKGDGAKVTLEVVKEKPQAVNTRATRAQAPPPQLEKRTDPTKKAPSSKSNPQVRDASYSPKRPRQDVSPPITKPDTTAIVSTNEKTAANDTKPSKTKSRPKDVTSTLKVSQDVPAAHPKPQTQDVFIPGNTPVCCPPSALPSINAELEELLQEQTLSKDQISEAMKIVRMFAEAVERRSRGTYTAVCVGSLASGLATRDSDIDIGIVKIGPPLTIDPTARVQDDVPRGVTDRSRDKQLIIASKRRDVKAAMSLLRAIRKWMPGQTTVQLFLMRKVRVPLVKLVHDGRSKWEIDVGILQRNTHHNPRLVAAWTAHSPLFAPLARAVKTWGRERSIINAASHYFNSWSLVLLVAQFLQLRGLLPVVHASSPECPCRSPEERQQVAKEYPRLPLNDIPLNLLEKLGENKAALEALRRRLAAQTVEEGLRELENYRAMQLAQSVMLGEEMFMLGEEMSMNTAEPSPEVLVEAATQEIEVDEDDSSADDLPLEEPESPQINTVPTSESKEIYVEGMVQVGSADNHFFTSAPTSLLVSPVKSKRRAALPSIGKLLADFFYFYGCIFDPSLFVVSVRRGHFLWRHEINQNFPNPVMIIEEPFEALSNTARSVDKPRGEIIKNEFIRATKMLAEGQSIRELIQPRK